ncbi:MAG TPA: hypothetical protein VFH99_01465 [Candidatus Saccharimonadales bacterium]|nr:hypothetical protein [Candidatus Saccharimonadales bacterium]
MTTASPPATKQDVEEIVGRVVGEIVSDAMQTLSNHMDVKFAEVDKRFDRLANKLETTVATVDHHTIDIRELQRKNA